MNNQKQKMKQVMMSKRSLMALLFAGILTISCSEEKKNDVPNDTPTTTTEQTKYETVSNEVLKDYLELKDALVETDEKNASAASEKLVSALENYELNNQSSKLSSSIVSATEQAKKMAGKNIETQRELFLTLSNDIIEIVEMTGTSTKLYQQYCPMYGDKGGIWLSAEEKIRNPYFGDKMMNCGEVKKEIN